MFTGIIEEIGKVQEITTGEKSSRLLIKCNKILEETNIGDSISTNGVCLTVTGIKNNVFEADVMAETFRRSNLGELKIGDFVNLERALPANGRFSGHMVSGHIDTVGEIASLINEGNAIWVTINTSINILKYIVEKGSITIDGISLTVAYVNDECFRVSIIPHTHKETTLAYRKIGDRVNLECDLIGKYVEKILGFNQNINNKKKDISMDFLESNGFI
ncbi:MAG: riboflavin synthase [Clostridium sp.]